MSGSRWAPLIVGVVASMVVPATVTGTSHDEATRQNLVIDMMQSVTAQSSQNRTSLASANWGIDRIDQRAPTRDNTFASSADGTGVYVYIVDGGINRSHTNFSGGFTGWSTTQLCSGNPTSSTQGCYKLSGNYEVAKGGGPRYDNNTVSDDCTGIDSNRSGHGSHVSGIVGSATYGVSPGAILVPVRVLDCYGEGDTVDIFTAIDWIEKRQAARPAGAKPAVVSFSLGFSASAVQSQDPTLIPDLQTAIETKLLNKGVVVVAASGNSAVDACDVYPAAIPGVISVAASDENDAEASYTDFGSCVDIYAPGTLVTSIGFRSTSATAVKSGTSMSAPFVSGAAALYLEANPSATPAEVWNSLKLNATACVISRHNTSRASQTPNRLLYAGVTASAPCAPSGVAATLSGTSVNVGWTLPTEGNGALITGYTATATGGPTPLACVASQPASGTSASCVIMGLAAGITYSVGVTSTSAGGTSALSAAATVAVPQDPVYLSTTSLKLKRSILLKNLVKSASTGTRTYRITSGKCSIRSTRFYAATTKGTCKLKVSIAKTRTTPAISKTFSIRVF